jgi:hypothetical protein
MLSIYTNVYISGFQNTHSEEVFLWMLAKYAKEIFRTALTRLYCANTKQELSIWDAASTDAQ